MQWDKAEQFRDLNDSVVAVYNRDDFDGICNFQSNELLTAESRKECTDDFRRAKVLTGKVVSSSLNDDLGSAEYFTWEREKKRNVSFELCADNGHILVCNIDNLDRPILFS
jgi:hypothetical protein